MNISPRVSQDVRLAVQLIGSNLLRLNGKRMLITGGTGFLGTWLIEMLAWFNSQCDRACQIDVLTRRPENFAQKAPHLAARSDIHLLSGDVQQFTSDRPYDFIIHAAAPADSGSRQQGPLQVATTIVEGTRRILEFASHTNVEGLLFVSSGAVYGTQPPTLSHIPEDYAGGLTISNPRAAYGEAKRYAELLCTLYCSHFGVPVRIARPFTFIGPYQDLDSGFAVTDFLRDGLRGCPLRVWGDGTTIRSYYYAADCVVALLKVLLEAPIGRCYNVGSDEALSILAVAHKVVAALGVPLEIIVAQQPDPGALPARYTPDISRGQHELGLKVWTDFDDALRRTVDWFRQMSR
ncbi:dTDP-glucose 4,6-dehydratase [Thermoflexales bacterium]|nr:dTDP-glucose 4,6-dehydratase [Thermoflexales bacterium]